MNIPKSIYFNRYAFAAIAVLTAIAFGAASCGGRNEVRNTQTETAYSAPADAININTASAADLQRIPHVGEKTALRIIEHREQYGPFRRPEHLMMIPGISDSRFRKIQHLVRVD